MMQKLSRRRGVVSIFLLIIFMVTYVFMGLLVDAARYRMAQTYVESALDMASDSVLSHYNRLLFDLYGLFALDTGEKEDEKVTEKIQEYYNTYLEETLGLVDADVDQYRTVLNEIFDTMTDRESSADISTKQMYDFKVDQLDCGTVINLADPKNVENQLIEYMKYRAPVQLVDKVFGEFLDKLDGIVSLEGQMDAAAEKLELMEKYQDLPQMAYDLQKEINAYASKLYCYTITLKQEFPAGQSSPDFGQPFRIKSFVEEFDKSIGEDDTNYYEVCQEIRDRAKNARKVLPKIYAEQIKLPMADVNALKLELDQALEEVDTNEKNDLDRAGEGLRQAYQGRKDELDEKLGKIVLNAEGLEEEASRLYKEIKNLVPETETGGITYTDYIKELEAARDAQSEDAEKATYDADIALAKSSAGGLLRNLDLLVNSEGYLGKSKDVGLRNLLLQEAEKVVKARPNAIIGGENEPKDFSKLGDKLTGDDGYKNAEQAKKLYSEEKYLDEYGKIGPAATAMDAVKKQQGILCILFGFAAHFQNKTDEEEDEKEIKKDVDLEEEQEEEDVEEVGLDNEELLESEDYKTYFTVEKTNFESEQDPDVDLDTGKEVNGEVSAGKIKNLFGQESLGKKLIGGIKGALEDGRDNLYLNAYIMSMFPNYYDYRTYKEYLTEDTYKKNLGNDETLPFPLQKEYWDYTASYASVEYIITGAGAGKGEAFGNGVKFGREDNVGIGEVSVKKIRTKLFGTRLLFNCLSVFTDSEKYQEASSLSAWAGPFSVVVALVLMVAWAVAETVIDVSVLMGDEFGKLIDESGEVPLIKNGDWYFSLKTLEEGIAEKFINGAVDGLTEAMETKVEEIGDGLKDNLNSVIYDVYNEAESGIEGCIDGIKEKSAGIIGSFSEQIAESAEGVEIVDPEIANDMGKIKNGLDNLESGFEGMLDNGKEKAEAYLGNVRDKAVTAVTRTTDAAVEKVNTVIGDAGESAKKAISDHLSDVVPKGDMDADMDENDEKFHWPKFSYKDYMNLYLFLMGSERKVCRIQSIIQANMHAGGQDDFWMKGSPTTVWADLECSIKYMFLSDPIIPKDMRRDGRLRLKVISGQGY